ncbi:hypothetical protein TNCT_68251 [Trichonephila clavata]|uniref:Uncharacterized protein n=1 Tax=Trichonephila clavata TaxID=2740835 RepID=A0A8X6KQD6_TRICU|nr:hypothetical protein TNCT_68251 [Trichonephila clavata]
MLTESQIFCAKQITTNRSTTKPIFKVKYYNRSTTKSRPVHLYRISRQQKYTEARMPRASPCKSPLHLRDSGATLLKIDLLHSNRSPNPHPQKKSFVSEVQLIYREFSLGCGISLDKNCYTSKHHYGY